MVSIYVVVAVFLFGFTFWLWHVRQPQMIQRSLEATSFESPALIGDSTNQANFSTVSPALERKPPIRLGPTEPERPPVVPPTAPEQQELSGGLERCPHCGVETRPGDQFCLNCGNRLTGSQPADNQHQWSPLPGKIPAAPVMGDSGDYRETVVANTTGNMEAQWAEEEEVEVTITTFNEAPAKLIVSRNGQTREFLLKKASISIGRAPSNDVALSGDQLASRRHALIHFDGVNYVLRDVGSASGTYINGVELRSPTPLSNGDHVGIGEHELIFFSVVEDEIEPTMTISRTGTVAVNPVPVAVPGQADTLEPAGPYQTQGDSVAADNWETEAVVEEDAEAEVKTTTEAGLMEQTEDGVFATAAYEETAAEAPVAASALAEVEMPEATIIERIELTEVSAASVEEAEVEEEEVAQADLPIAERLRIPETVNEEEMPLPVPPLPDIPALLSAIKSLDTRMSEYLERARTLGAQAQQLHEYVRAAGDQIAAYQSLQTLQCSGEMVLPKKVYKDDSRNIALVVRVSATIPGELPEGVQVQNAGSKPRMQGQEASERVEIQIQQKDRSEQYLEAELVAAGFTVAGDLRQRQSLTAESLAYRWNCYFLNSGDQAMILVLRVIHPAGSREIGTIQHTIKVTKFANLTARQLGMLTWISGAATFISTLLGIGAALRLLP